MSLVNDMLRDLEQRNESPATAPGNQSAVKAAQYVEETPVNSAPRYVLWVIGFAALAMTLWLLWQPQPSVQESEDQTSLSETNGKSPNLVVESEAVDSDSNRIIASTDTASPQVEILNTVNSVAEPVQIATKLTKIVDVSEIKWAGTDFGGDLVIRLSGDADIQVVNQKDKAIVIALDNVALKTTLPLISSPFVQRLGMDVDSQNRTLLTLTTHVSSQFAFRIESSPTTLILGVIPQQVEPQSQEISIVSNPIDVKPEVLNPKNLKADIETAKPLKSGSELHVGTSEGHSISEPKKVKPVEKTRLALTDSQVTERARGLISKGNVDGAEKLLRNLITDSPQKAPMSRGLLATLLLSKGNMQGSQHLLTESLRLYPHNRVLKKLQARIWMSEGKAERVIALLDVQPPAIAQDPEYYELMATGFQQQGKPDQAAQVYYQLLQLNNDVPRWWVGMGYALEQVKRYSDARNAYQSGIQIPSIDRSLKNYARQRIQALAGR